MLKLQMSLVIVIIFVMSNFFSFERATAKDNLTLALPFATTDKLQQQITKFTSKVIEESEDKVSFEIKNLDQSSNLIDKVLNEDIDLAWIISDYNPGRYSWLKLFAWPGITLTEDRLVRNLHEIYNNFLKDKRDFFGLRVLAIGIYPKSVLLAKKPYKNIAELRGKKIRCRNIDCESYLAKFGMKGLSYQDEEIENLLDSDNIVGILQNPKIGRNIYPAEDSWELEAKYKVMHNFNWGRMIGILIISDSKWSRLEEDTRKLLSYYSGVNLSLQLTRGLNHAPKQSIDKQKDDKLKIDLARSDLNQANQEIKSWRVDAIKNIRNISPIILEEVDHFLTE